MSKRRPIILLVEDTENDVFFFRRALSALSADIEVRVVVNGADAQAYIEGRRGYADRVYYPQPDLIVCDFKMPQKTGAEFLQWLRTQKQFEHIPFVVYSGSVLKKEEETAMRLGATLYLRKSGDFRSTIEDVRTILALLAPTLPSKPVS